MGENPVVLPVKHVGKDSFVPIPALAAWSCGWLQM
jgi:hypothetical protein